MTLRPLTAAAALLVVGAALTACHPASGPIQVDGCTPPIQPGQASNSVLSATDAEVTAEAPFETPLEITGSQASITGATENPAEAGDVVLADYTLYDGASGFVLQSTDAEVLAAAAEESGAPSQEASAPLIVRTGDEALLSEGLQCATADSRVSLVASFGELFGDSVAQAGIDPQSTAVLVLDVSKTFAGRAEGAPQPGSGSMPAIALAPDGTPGVTFPDRPAPTELQVATTIQGGGAVVEADDQLVVQYTLLEWGAEDVTETTWGSTPAQFSLDTLIEGFQQAVVGKQVGSQVVAVVPPEVGYQDGRTLVFVIDILDAEAP